MLTTSKVGADAKAGVPVRKKVKLESQALVFIVMMNYMAMERSNKPKKMRRFNGHSDARI